MKLMMYLEIIIPVNIISQKSYSNSIGYQSWSKGEIFFFNLIQCVPVSERYPLA